MRRGAGVRTEVTGRRATQQVETLRQYDWDTPVRYDGVREVARTVAGLALCGLISAWGLL